MKLKEFDYSLPKGLIAQHPPQKRGESRMMVLDRKRKAINHRNFSDITDHLERGDCLVLNNTKVIQARLFGKRRTGGKVEIFILHAGENPVTALVRPSVRIKEGEVITLESGDWARVLGRADVGRFIEFDKPLDGILERSGHVPLPPYITRPDEAYDKERYQTVYAQHEGATASPTAGLHFTDEAFRKLEEKGVETAYVTLHVSYGTFAPVLEEDVERHKMHREYFELPESAVNKIKNAKQNGKKVIAVGTTTIRVLESNADKLTTQDPQPITHNGWTNLFIYPGYKFKVADMLLTNFHLPKSTLLMLVSAFAGRDLIFEAYDEAIRKKYRFFSYGDCMLIK